MALIKLILVAKKALAAAFTNSAVGISTTRNGIPDAIIGANTSRSAASDLSSLTPTTKRSGRRESSNAVPSLRNSGFQARCGSKPVSSASLECSAAAVPTGTVDLPTTTDSGFRCGAKSSMAEKR